MVLEIDLLHSHAGFFDYSEKKDSDLMITKTVVFVTCGSDLKIIRLQ